MIKRLTPALLPVFLSIAALLLAPTPAAWAQAGRGGINGLVSDPTGASVPAARVIATNHATGIEQAAVTTAAGLYYFCLPHPRHLPGLGQRKWL